MLLNLARRLFVLCLVGAGLALAPLQAAGVTVVVSPSTATLVPGATQQFTVKVSGTTKTAVTWSCTANGGTVDSTGFYTAPMAVGTFTVKATLNSDTTKVGTATVTVAKNIQVSLSGPTVTTTYPGDVVWYYGGSTGGLDTTGAVSWTYPAGATVKTSSISYAAFQVPSAPGTYAIRATSVEDPTKSAGSSFQVLDPSVVTLSSPSPASVAGLPFSTQSLSVVVRGGTTQHALWSATGGTLGLQEAASGASVVYQLPTAAGSYSIKVTAKDDSTKTLTIPVTVQSATSQTIYGIDTRNHVFLPGSSAQIVPWFNAGGATATLDHGIGTAVSGTTYSVTPTSLTQYLLTLKSTKATNTQLSDWVAPGIATTVAKDSLLLAATAYDQRPSGSTVVVRPDGRIVVAGGGKIQPGTVLGGGTDSAYVPLADERVFDPASGSITTTQGVVRGGHAALMCADGRVRYFGGAVRDGSVYDATITEVDGNFGGLVNTSEGFRDRYQDARVLQIVDGRVVLIGGMGGWTSYASADHTWYYTSVRQGATDWVEIRDLKTIATDFMRMQRKRQGGVAILLKDGRVFVAGGSGNYDQPEVLNLSTKTSALTVGFKGFWDAHNSIALSLVAGAALMQDGKVLILETQLSDNTNWAGIWDPVADTYTRKLQLPSVITNLFQGDSIGDGVYPVGYVTRTNPTTAAPEAYLFLYDSVKNVVISSQNLNSGLSQDSIQSLQWVGMTAQGDILISAQVLPAGGGSAVPQLIRVRLTTPTSVFPGQLSMPLGASFTFHAWSSTNQTIAWSLLEGVSGGTVNAVGVYQAPTTAGIYHVVATTAGGRAVATVRVLPAPPSVDQVTVTPSSGPVGSTVTVSWNVQWADTLHLVQLDASSTVLSDQVVTGLTSTQITILPGAYTLELRATNKSGQSIGDAIFTAWAVQSVSISPSSANFYTGRAASFTASVVGAGSTPTTVTWSCTGGAITQDGIYTPTAVGSYTVTATSTVDPAKSATARVTVVEAPPNLINPSIDKTTIAPGGAATVTWQGVWAYNTPSPKVTLTIKDMATAATQVVDVSGLTGYTAHPVHTSTLTFRVTSASGLVGTQVYTVTVDLTVGANLYLTPNPVGFQAPFTATVFYSVGSTRLSILSGGGTWVDLGPAASGAGIQIDPSQVTWTGVDHVSVQANLTDTNGNTGTLQANAPIKPKIISFTSSVPGLLTGALQPVTLSWALNSASRAATLDLKATNSQGTVSVPLSFGGATSAVVNPTETTTYTLTITTFYDSPLGSVAMTDQASLTVTVGAVASVQVSPTTAKIASGESTTLTASVVSLPGKDEVTWSASGGSIVPNGLSASYTAPAATGTYTVTVSSVVDPTKRATATITVWNPPVTLSITPTYVSMNVGATMTFGHSISVTGSSNSLVAWSVQEGAAGGTISQAGYYTAPMTPGVYHIVVTSQANPAVSAVANVTVTLPDVQVSISPSTLSLVQGRTYQFGFSSSNGSVTWSATGGTITGVGLYTAPLAVGTYTVTATSLTNPAKSASAAVTVTLADTPSISIMPGSGNLFPSGSLKFSATVIGLSNTAVSWRVLEPGGGAMAPDGTYTAPASLGTYTVVATSAQDTSLVATSKVAVGFVLVSPDTPVVAPGLSKQFSASLAQGHIGPITWSIDEGASGGSITPDGGLYTAPTANGVFHVRATLPDGSQGAMAIQVGLIDDLVVGFPMQVMQAGTYRITAQLKSSNGNTLSQSAELFLQTGIAAPELKFMASDIRRNLGVDGPWEVVDVEVEYQDPNEGQFVPADLAADLGPTEAYLLRQLRQPWASLTGDFQAAGVTTSPTGTPLTGLEARIGVNVLGAGTYQVSAVLVNGNGNRVATATLHTVTLPAGVSYITVVFPGSQIAQNQANGPYTVSELTIIGPTSLVLKRVGIVSGFNWSQFQ